MYSQTSWIVMKVLKKTDKQKQNVQFPHEKQENKYLKNTRILHL